MKQKHCWIILPLGESNKPEIKPKPKLRLTYTHKT